MIHVEVERICTGQKTPSKYYLPQRYSLIGGKEDRGTLKHQRPNRLTKVEQNPLPENSRVLKRLLCLDHNRAPLDLNPDQQLQDASAISRGNE